MATISIIIPAYNVGGTITSAVDSIQEQWREGVETIIVDDGSTDNTASICMGLNVEGLHYIRTDNGGVSHARNIGIERSTGEYIMFLDGDDRLAPGTLSVIMNTIEETPADLLCFGYEDVDETFQRSMGIHRTEDQRYKGDDVCRGVENIKRTINLNVPWNKVFHAATIRRWKLRFDESLNVGEDFIFVLDYLDHVSTLHTLDLIGYQYRNTTGGLKGTMRENELEARLAQEERLRGFYVRHGYDSADPWADDIRIALSYLQRRSLNWKQFKDAGIRCAENPILLQANRHRSRFSKGLRLASWMLFTRCYPVLFALLRLKNRLKRR